MFENMELTVLSRDRWRVLKFGSCGPKDLKKKKALAIQFGAKSCRTKYRRTKVSGWRVHNKPHTAWGGGPQLKQIQIKGT